MNPSLQGYAAAALEEVASGDLGTVAADLARIERAVVDHPTLVATLTDTALAAPIRRAVLVEVLSGKVDANALALAGHAVAVVAAQESLVALTWLANRARLEAEGRLWVEEPLSATSARRRVGGYAVAIFERTDVERLRQIEDELFSVARLIERTPALRSALVDRDRAPAARAGLLRSVLSGKVTAETERIVAYVAIGGRPRDVVGTTDYLVAQAAIARGWRVARVRTGAALDAAQVEALESSLSAVAGNPVDLQITVDPALLAGVLVELGDLRLDDTVRGRLDALREHLRTAEYSFVSQITTNHPHEGAS